MDRGGFMAAREDKFLFGTTAAPNLKPFQNIAVQALFHVLCEKWLCGMFQISFLPRSDWAKKGKAILETGSSGKETLFIPEDADAHQIACILNITGPPERAERALTGYLFDKGMTMLAKTMPYDSMREYIKNAILHWKQGQTTLREALRIDSRIAELEAVKATGDIFQIADKEREIADKIQLAVCSLPFVLDCHNPSDIIANQGLNCRGASLLGGALLREVGIPYLVGDVPFHSILILAPSDDTIEWRDFLAPRFNERITDAMIEGTSKTGRPLKVADLVAYAKDPTPDGIMFDIVGDEYRKKLSWVKEGHRQFLTLFPPGKGLQMQILNGVAFALAQLARIEGDAVKKKHYFDQAIGAYQLASAYSPKYEYAYNGTGDTFSNMGEYHEAISSYEKARNVNPRNAACFYGLGEAQLAIGLKDEALHSYRRFLELADADKHSYWKSEAEKIVSRLAVSKALP